MTRTWMNYNGITISSDKEIIKADNRGFRYGDGLFETMRMINGAVPLADLHFDRLMHGIQMLQFDKPSYFTREYLLKQILELAAKNNHHKQVRIRLTVFRGEGGLYDTESHFPNYIIQTWKLPDEKIHLNENGLILDIFPDARIAPDNFSSLKSNNYLPYFMGALFVKKNQLNDCVLLNTNEHLCDATIANVFIIRDGVVTTPPLSDGCVAGVMRKHLIDQAPSFDFPVVERSLNIDDLIKAEEMFLTNAIYGIKWVKQFRQTSYLNNHTARIFKDIILKVFLIAQPLKLFCVCTYTTQKVYAYEHIS